MTAIRATRAPAGVRGRPMGPPTVRYDTQAAWPGIDWGFNARCATCTWAYRNGIYQIKYLDVMCMVHRGLVNHG